jgi:hypothetical protein
MARAAVNPLVLPVPTATQRVSASDAVDDVIVYCYLNAMWVGNTAGNLVLPACYDIGWATYVTLVMRVMSDVFIGSLLAIVLLFPFTIMMLLVRIDRRQAEHMLLVGEWVTTSPVAE